MTILVRGFQGLGDNIYQRPFIDRLCQGKDQVYLETSWPQIYKDIDNLRFVRPKTKLRTQLKNIYKNDFLDVWSIPPKDADVIELSYNYGDLQHLSIPQIFEAQLGLPPNGWFPVDLPSFEDAEYPIELVNETRPIAVIRPVTIRSEWKNESRAPDPIYIELLATHLRKVGFATVSIADTEEDREWIAGNLPRIDYTYHKGELDLEQTFNLIHDCAIVVGGPGWVIPAAIFAGRPTFIVFGGNGAANSHEKILDPRMNLNNVGWALPENFCMCDKTNHECDKQIRTFWSQWYSFCSRVKIV